MSFSRWMVQASDPEVKEALAKGRAFLSKIEGEWWLSF